MKVKKKRRLCSQVSVCRLQQWEENVRVDKLTCVGYGKARKRPCGRVGLCRLRQKIEIVCVDEKACVGYVLEKKMSIWTGWPV